MSLIHLLIITIFSVGIQFGSGLRIEKSNPEYLLGANDNSVGLFSCKTATHGPGICVTVSECPDYMKLIISSTRPKICHWSGQVPVICCPVTGQQPKRTTKIPSKPEEPTKDNQHECDQSACGTRRSIASISLDVSRILGGEDAYPSELPWNVAIFSRELNGDNSISCGGSIISDRYVLTAAHCFDLSTRTSNYILGVGSNDLRKTIKFDLDKIILHPKYVKGKFYHDIALIRVNEKFIFNDTLRPVCLPSEDSLTHLEESPSSDPLIVSGWGDTKHDGLTTNLLKKANLNLMSRKFCNEAYSRLRSTRISQGITSDFICAGKDDGKKDACQSDSGGPLILKVQTDGKVPKGYESKFIQVGIVSFGYKCGVAGYPGVYVNVPKYLSWIRENIKEPSE